MKSNYNKAIFKGLLIQGKLHEAVTYLESFEDKVADVKKYHERFEGRKFGNKTKNLVINNILNAYANYYVDYFWDKKTELEARKSLQHRLMEIINYSVVLDFSECEKLIGELVEQQGYSFLGDTTGMLYGPYIWKSNKKVVYEVEIPSGIQKVTINMLDGFVSRSWLDFIALGKIGTSGWASPSGELYCVRKSYKNKLNTLSFKISYLKHEAQHLSDFELNKEMDGVDLEYRAKLTELIYYPNLKLFHLFINEASKKEKCNSHSYASYLIVRNLSERIFNEEYVSSWSRWRGKGKQIRKYAYKLLEKDTMSINSHIKY
ncbi:MAG: hypothetical protein RR636_14815 [Clostridium sp.]|uniref:hypothetical protein n=1 Tax=Clostridium sp. TaxID=1506 RepID=UPI0030438464